MGHVYSDAFMMGIPFMLLGYEINKRFQCKSFVRRWAVICMAIFGCAISVVECILMKVAAVRIGTGILTSVALFVLAATSEKEYCFLVQVGRKYSRDVYIWHVLVARVLRKALSVLGLYGYAAIQWGFPVMVLLVSVGVAVVISQISGVCPREKLQKQQEGEAHENKKSWH